MDFDIIKQAVELTTSAGTAVKGIGTAVDTVKGWVKTKGDEVPAEVREVIADLAGKVSDAKLANAELTAKLAEVQQKLIREDEFAKAKEEFELVQTAVGEAVYQSKSNRTLYACPVCMGEKKIAYLGPGTYSRDCRYCNRHFDFQHYNPVY